MLVVAVKVPVGNRSSYVPVLLEAGIGIDVVLVGAVKAVELTTM